MLAKLDGVIQPEGIEFDSVAQEAQTASSTGAALTNREREPNLAYFASESLMTAWSEFLEEDVGAGAASDDTIRTYATQIKQYFLWCSSQGINPGAVTRKEIKAYRHWLHQERGYKRATIALKLTAVRRFYEAAVEAGLMPSNPAIGVKPPLQKRDPAEQITFLEKEEVHQLIETVTTTLPRSRVEIDNVVKAKRDLVLISIMLREGPRTIELHRANLSDLVRQGNNLGIRVEGKRSLRIVPLTVALAELLGEYLEARKQTGETLLASSPLFASVGNRSRGGRLSRSRIRALVSEYLTESGLKERAGRTLSTHSLRHTAGTLAVRAGASLRQVQDLLGHADPRMTALYVHVGDRWSNNPAALWD